MMMMMMMLQKFWQEDCWDGWSLKPGLLYELIYSALHKPMCGTAFAYVEILCWISHWTQMFMK